MFKKMKVALAAAACLVLSVSAVSAQEKLPFESAKGGIMMYTVKTTGEISEIGSVSGTGLVAGINKEIQDKISVSAEYMFTLIKPTKTVGGTEIEFSASSLAGYGVYTHPVNEQVSVYGKAGLALITADATVAGTTYTDQSLDLTYGFGGTFKIDEKLSASAEYLSLGETDSTKTSGFGVNATYKF